MSRQCSDTLFAPPFISPWVTGARHLAFRLAEEAEVEAQRKAELEVVHKLRAAKGVLEQLTVSSAPGAG